MELPSLTSRPLVRVELEVESPQSLGATEHGERRIVPVSGGTFHGDRLRGKVLGGGSDWIVVRPDGTSVLDVRLVLETDDAARIAMTYRGLRHGPPEVMARLAAGESVDPKSYYFRTAPAFETTAPAYAWLGRIICVAVGFRSAAGVIYEVYEIT